MQALTTNGRPMMLGFDVAPPAAFLPVPAWRSPTWLMPALVVAMMALLLAGLAWPVAAIARKVHRVPSPHAGRAGTSYRLSRISGLCAVAVFTACLLFIVYVTADLPRLSSTTSPMLVSLQVMALIVFPIAVAAALYDAVIVFSARRKLLARLWALVLVAGSTTMLWVALAFHLMKISTHY
jgi:hypothetical protein